MVSVYLATCILSPTVRALRLLCCRSRLFSPAPPSPPGAEHWCPHPVKPNARSLTWAAQLAVRDWPWPWHGWKHICLPCRVERKSTEENRWEVLDKKQCCHECTAPWRVRGHEQSLSFSSLPRMHRTVHYIIYVPAAPWVHEYHLTAADICIA